MSLTSENNKEKPEYGYYVGYRVITTCFVLGAVGLIFLVSGFFVKYYLDIVFWVAGILLLILFLWPAFGMFYTKRSMYRDEKLRLDFLDKFEEAQILDCGCGSGRHAIPLAKQIHKGSLLTGIDIYDTNSISVNSLERIQTNAMLEGVSDKTRFMVGSITDIPFDNEAFDVVTCMGVMHELGRFKSKAFREIGRVLKPHGLLYFRELKRWSMVPFIGIFALIAFKSKKYWERELKNNGFEIVQKGKSGNYYEFLARRLTEV